MSSSISTKDTLNPIPFDPSESESNSPQLQKPDNALLADIEFPSTMAIQPDWIRDRYPEYAIDHGMDHELTSVRLAEHNGHQIKITTTYQIEIDGRSVHLHAMVDNDGKLFCHTTPYVEYQSAVDLVKALMDRFPESFTPEDGRRDELHEPTEHGHEHDSSANSAPEPVDNSSDHADHAAHDHSSHDHGAHHHH